jgi:hypothetical protein
VVARQSVFRGDNTRARADRLGCFVLMGIELAVRQSGYGQCERWRFVLAWGLGVAAVAPVAILFASCLYWPLIHALA